MQAHILELMRQIVGLVAGTAIGIGFGMIQNLGLRRNERRQQEGQLKGAMGVMPGSMRRVAYLMLALVLIQIVCPLLFADGTQWWVSGGVCLGYGSLLFLRLRQA